MRLQPKGTGGSVVPAVLHKSSPSDTGAGRSSVPVFCSELFLGRGTAPFTLQPLTQAAYANAAARSTKGVTQSFGHAHGGRRSMLSSSSLFSLQLRQKEGSLGKSSSSELTLTCLCLCLQFKMDLHLH